MDHLLALNSDDEDRERTQYILRALHPDLPLALKGLRMTGAGTGFFVASRAILTNKHVVKNCKSVTSQLNGEASSVTIAGVLSFDTENDLALLESSVPTDRPATFESKPERSNVADLSVIGFSSHGLISLVPSVTAAMMSSNEVQDSRPILPFKGDIHPGNSGSPLINQFGDVLGVVTAKVDTVATYRRTGAIVTDRGLLIGGDIVMKFLGRVGTSYRLDAAQEALTPEERLKQARHYITLLGCWN